MYYVLHFIIAIVTATNACTYVYSIKFECLLFRAVDDTFK
jgi:hypothetical protein